MRIVELISAKSSRDLAKRHFDPNLDLKKLYPDPDPDRLSIKHHINTFLEKIYERGFEHTQLGHGVRGIVFERFNDPYVIKIFHRDPNYLKYIKLAADNQDNPHFPKLRGKPVKIAPDTYAVRMEKLEPITDPTTLPKNSFTLFREVIGTNEVDDGVTNDWIKQYAPKMHELFVKMENVFGGGMLLDLHYGNIMKRKSEIVVIDPVI